MSGFEAISPEMAKEIGTKLETLTKSFAAGYQGLQNAGRTGISALAREQLDPVMRTITLEEKDFLLTKDIPTLQAKQTVYMYDVKTAVRSGVDLAGFEAFLPQEDHQQYLRVAEVLKIYGIRKTITEMAMLVNQEDGYSVDIEKENDLNAALAMAENMERDAYVGGDLFMDAQGDFDSTIAANPNAGIRQVRGLQANIREGDQSARGIAGDFVGYGNNRSVVFDKKGGVLDRGFLDKVVTAVGDARGRVAEAHCTTSQLAEFRATFFPFERGDLGAMYAIRGAGVTNEEKDGLPIQTIRGVIDFIPTVFKYTRTFPEPVFGSNASQPAQPSSVTPANAGSATGSGFAGEDYVYVVQSVNMHGISLGTASATHTSAADEAVDLTIALPGGNSVTELRVFRTPKEAAGDVSKAMFIGRIAVKQGSTSATFRDNGKLIPGLDSILFLPRDKNRAKLAVLGNLLNKSSLGLRGLATETVYSSYWCVIVDRPRSFALVSNVFQQREGL